MRGAQLFTGSSNKALATKICDRLTSSLSQCTIIQQPNSETKLDIGVSVRNQNVFIIQSCSAPTNDHLMELLMAVSACRFASAKKIIAVIPYYPYSKHSKKKSGRDPITAKLIADMLHVAGVNHVITMDLHLVQIRGFFDVPVDNLYAEPTIVSYIVSTFNNFKEGVVIAKNPGSAKRVTAFADKLKIPFAIGLFDENHQFTLVGDVKDKIAFLIDDMIDDCTSFIKTANHTIALGAQKVIVIATHAVMCEKGLVLLEDCANIERVIVTNTIPIRASPKVTVMDISHTLAEAIRRIHNGESVSYLYKVSND